MQSGWSSFIWRYCFIMGVVSAGMAMAPFLFCMYPCACSGQFPEEGPLVGPGDPDGKEAADEGVLSLQPDQAIARGPGGEALLIPAVHQTAHGLSDIGRVALLRDLVLPLHQALEVFELLLPAHGVGHGGGGACPPGGNR